MSLRPSASLAACIGLVNVPYEVHDEFQRLLPRRSETPFVVSTFIKSPFFSMPHNSLAAGSPTAL